MANPSESAVRPEPGLDRIVDRLFEHRDSWVRVDLRRRIEYLRRSIDGVLEVAEGWVEEACRRKGVDPASSLAGEEWTSGPMTAIRGLRLFIMALRARGRPRPASISRRPDGQLVARVFPRNPIDRFLYYNLSGEVWIEPGQPATQGRIYRDKESGVFPPGNVALVLGAGNVSSIGPLDAIYKLFVEDQVVVMKMNPVNDYLGPFFERAFACLIRDGYLALVYGGADVGEYLCQHPRVATIHLTGSDRTHDAIVWGGDPEERERRKREGRPRVHKPITAELGCVTPVIVVPDHWSRAALEFQARHVASMVGHNASFNCTAGKVLVLPQAWAQREEFLDRVKAALAAIPPRRAYYPGAEQRYNEFLRQYPQKIELGRSGSGVVPWTLIPDVPAETGEYALANEAFCGVLAEVSLEGGDLDEYLDRAVGFANDTVWGTLSAVLLVDRATQRSHSAAIDSALAKLRYGSLGLNVWTGVNFFLGVTTWGAFPGHTAESIGSGRGIVHNAYLFDHPQKSIVRAPFRIWPKPAWFADHRNLDALGRRLTRFEARPSAWSLLRVALSGIRG